MAPLELKDVQISTIQPFRKTDHAVAMEGSILDVSYLDIYVPMIFCYKSTSKQSDAAGLLIAKMKESLGKVLVPFFPLAGRWVRTYDARIRELQCTDEGVPFIEASVDVELDSVLNMGSFEMNSQLGGFKLLGLDPTAFNQEVDAPSPAVFVQVTKFKCGGVSMNFSFCHMTADGQGIMKFMKAWSEFALNDETSIIPNHDRSLVLPRKAFTEFLAAAENGGPQPKNDSESKSSAASAVQSNGAMTATSEEEERRMDPGDANRIRSVEPLVCKIWHVKRKAVEDLKRKAAEEKVDITTVDLISAHLWQSVCSSLVGSNEKPISLLSTYVDGRKRFHDPPLSDNYIGNAVVPISTPPVPLKELTSHSLSSAASIIHSAVAGVNPVTTLKYSLLASSKIAPLPALPFAHLAISSWFRFPMYEVSFGCGYGHPVFACWNVSSQFMPLGLAIIFPPPPSYSEDTIASVQIMISDKDGLPEALFSDEKFLSLFHTSSNRPL